MILGSTNGFSVVCLFGIVSFTKLKIFKKRNKSQKNIWNNEMGEGPCLAETTHFSATHGGFVALFPELKLFPV